MTARTYTLLGPDRQPYQSTTPGALGGYRRARIYGRLDCPAALRAIARGQYVRNRVFFADEQTAVAAGYRPCAVCLPDAYAQWKAAGLSEVGAAGDFTQELPRKLLPTRPKEAQRRGGRVVQTPIQAPKANAYAERFVRSVREECLDRLILFGERRVLHVLAEFVAHSHRERNHQGLGNDLIAPEPRALAGRHVRCRERLGRLLC